MLIFAFEIEKNPKGIKGILYHKKVKGIIDAAANFQ